MYVVAAAFCAYFVLISYCDIFTPEPFGAALVWTERGSVVTSVARDSAADRAGLLQGDLVMAIDDRPLVNKLDWSAAFARLAIRRPVVVNVLRADAPRQLDLVFGPTTLAPWDPQRRLWVLGSRLVQFITLGFALALVLRTDGQTALVGGWLLGTISVFSVGLPPRLGSLWQVLPRPLGALLLIPSISTVTIGGILFLFCAVLLRVRPTRAWLVLLGLVFTAVAAWQTLFIWALVYEPGRLARLTGAMPAVVVINLVFVAAGLTLLAWRYRALADPLERRRLRWQGVAESLAVLPCERVGTTPMASDAADDRSDAWDPRLTDIVDELARGRDIDWNRELENTDTDDQREVLRQLQALDEIMHAGGRLDPPPSPQPEPGPRDTPPARPIASRWGEFELLDRIGAGSVGSVYRAWDPHLHHEVAVKLLDAERPDRDALLMEARNLAQVRPHQNVVHVYGAAIVDGAAGFWMELIRGRTLSDLIREQGPFGAIEAAGAGIAMSRALSAIHLKELVHQDVKAQNVMREQGGRLVLMDLGASGPVDSGAAPRWGTPLYMAPELFEGESATPRTDIYSLGVLLFHLVTGTFPSTGRTYDAIAQEHRRRRIRVLHDLRPDLPESFLAVVEQALADHPSDRFATAGEMGRGLRLVDA